MEGPVTGVAILLRSSDPDFPDSGLPFGCHTSGFGSSVHKPGTTAANSAAVVCIIIPLRPNGTR